MISQQFIKPGLGSRERLGLSINSQRAYVPTYHLDQSLECYCRSGKSFGDCCASPGPDGDIPASINIVHDFLTPAERKGLLRFARRQPSDWLRVFDSKASTATKTVHKKDPSRVAKNVLLGKKEQTVVNWFSRAVQEHICPLGAPEWFEAPQLLLYGPGGKYVAHADAEDFDKQQGQFFRIIDRDFSMLLYLNDDYEGGDLYFKHLQFQYKPRAGDLLTFPSNHIFTHESRPIIRGSKFALVSWGAFKNTPRVMSAPHKILWDEQIKMAQHS